MKKTFIGILSVTLIILVSLLFSPDTSHGEELKDSILRFHVLANSDEPADQQLKLELKEEILTYMAGFLAADTSVEEIRAFITAEEENLVSFAENFIREKGYDYPVSLQLITCYFPTKAYGDMVFPCGDYEALRIVIGEGAGKNWWCVLYPPLCFIGTEEGIVPPESKQMLKNLLSAEDYEMLTIQNYDEKDIKIKFKLLELFK